MLVKPFSDPSTTYIKVPSTVTTIRTNPMKTRRADARAPAAGQSARLLPLARLAQVVAEPKLKAPWPCVGGSGDSLDDRLEMPLALERVRDEAAVLGLLQQRPRLRRIGAGGNRKRRVSDEASELRDAVDVLQH